MDSRISVQRERIERVREALARHGAHALLVPSADPHLSEYLPARWQGRQWLSGFTGSMGTLVVTLDQAALFADSRYWVQAEAELAGSGIDTGEDPHRRGDPPHRLARAHARQGPDLDGRRRGARPGLGAAAARGARQGRHRAAHRRRPAGRSLARPARAARAPRLRTPGAAGAWTRAQRAGTRCARRWRATARRTTSSPPSTTSRGSPTCAAATSNYNPVFLAHLLIDAQRRHAVRRRRQDRRRARRAPARPTASRCADYAGAADALRALPAECHAADRPAPRHARPSAAGARRRARDRGDQSRARCSRAARAITKRSSCARRWRDDGAAMCAFYAWFEQALAAGERITELTIDERLSAERAQAARLHRPELFHHRRASTPTARCRTTAPPRQSHAIIAGDGLLLIDSGAPVPRRHHRHHARVADRQRQRSRSGATTRWCSRR